MLEMQTPSGWPDATYHEAARQALARVETVIDRWLDQDVVDIDCARSGGMLTLSLPDRSQLIINMQPPLHELWLAARSGGYHFKFEGDQRWMDTRTGVDFFTMLSDCASEQAGLTLNF